MAVNLLTRIQNGRACLRCQHAESPCLRLCACRVTGRQLIDHQESGDCPLSLFPPPVEGPEAPPELHPTMTATGGPCANPERWGPFYWARLHAAARDGKLTAEWLAKWLADIPCAECRTKATALVAAEPLDAEPGRWAWRFHNAVNEALGKPAFAWEAARARWSTP